VTHQHSHDEVATEKRRRRSRKDRERRALFLAGLSERIAAKAESPTPMPESAEASPSNAASYSQPASAAPDYTVTTYDVGSWRGDGRYWVPHFKRD
jgi:hypothetical protein